MHKNNEREMPLLVHHLNKAIVMTMADLAGPCCGYTSTVLYQYLPTQEYGFPIAPASLPMASHNPKKIGRLDAIGHIFYSKSARIVNTHKEKSERKNHFGILIHRRTKILGSNAGKFVNKFWQQRQKKKEQS